MNKRTYESKKKTKEKQLIKFNTVINFQCFLCLKISAKRMHVSVIATIKSEEVMFLNAVSISRFNCTFVAHLGLITSFSHLLKQFSIGFKKE